MKRDTVAGGSSSRGVSPDLEHPVVAPADIVMVEDMARLGAGPGVISGVLPAGLLPRSVTTSLGGCFLSGRYFVADPYL